jgi:hypothetical protein
MTTIFISIFSIIFALTGIILIILGIAGGMNNTKYDQQDFDN